MYALKLTKRNIRRSPFQATAASMAMFSALFALLTFFLLATASQMILRYYEGKPQVIAFFKDETTDQDITAIQNALQNDPRVSKMKYVTKEEALQIYRNATKDQPILNELVTASILPASLEVSTHFPEDLDFVAELLEKEPVVESIVFPKDVIASITSGAKLIRSVGGGVVTYLILFAVLQTLMIISFKIRLKRDEIEIMRLMGAPSSFIRTPFILEGMFYGLVGAITSWVTVYILLWYFEPFIQFFLGEIQLLPVNPLFMLTLLAAEMALAIVIGALGSFLAVRRYLRI
jgi:cell division transport system permease protein